MENNGTGILYPTIELGGATFTLRFTRGALLYRLSRRGVTTADLNVPAKSFGALVEVLHATMEPQFLGTHEQLAEIMEAAGIDKLRAYRAAVDEALGKVFPPIARPAAETKPEAAPLTQ